MSEDFLPAPRVPRFLLRTLVMIIVLVAVGGMTFFSGTATKPPDLANALIIQSVYPDYARFIDAANHIDIWFVDHTSSTFQAMVSPSQYEWLTQNGFKVVVDELSTSQIASELTGVCYRTIQTLYQQLAEINQVHPTLTELSQYGESVEGRPLWVLRISNEANQGIKPRTLIMSGTHGREMITPEAAMLFIDYLLIGYFADPNIKMLVDWQETYVIVSANPDGHVRNEGSFAWWRKNTNPYTTCSSGTYGVDLNRNHNFQWGTAGASTNPCSEIYRGPGPDSEPETIGLQELVRSLFPDQRGPLLTDPAPAHTTGVLITVHSFADLILWPWGDTFTPAPNSQGLSILGQQMAQFNGYTPAQSIELYPTSGTTDDWAYGELGIAAYTFEIGGGGDGFNPSCARYEALTQPNLHAFFYAAQASFAPYTMPSGPEVKAINLSKSHIEPGESVSVTATAREGSLHGENIISEIRLFIDTPPWAGGTAIALQPIDSGFDTSEETGTLLLAVANLAEGEHTLIVQAQDNQGNWGLISATRLFVGTPIFVPILNK